MRTYIEIALLAAAFGQACVAVLNLNLPRIMAWKPDLEKLPLLLREVFYIHTLFISITLGIFAMVTARFAHEIAYGAEPVYRWLAGAIGVFWGIRAILQVAYYSSSHWRGIPSRTLVHIALLATYGSWAGLYLFAASVIHL